MYELVSGGRDRSCSGIDWRLGEIGGGDPRERFEAILWSSVSARIVR